MGNADENAWSVIPQARPGVWSPWRYLGKFIVFNLVHEDLS